MIWSKLTERALNTAAHLHDGQYRKGTAERLPYIIHLVAVANIVSRHTDDEEIVAAALLHDTLEDTPYRFDELKNDFNERIAGIVIGTTIPQKLLEKGDVLHTYDQRGYLENLLAAPRESSYVSAGDKIHNFEQSADIYEGKPEAFLRDFRNSLDERARYYQPIVDLVSTRIPEAFAEELRLSWERQLSFLRSLAPVLNI